MEHGLIDGDLILFRSAIAAGDYARKAASNTLEQILSSTLINSYHIYLTGSGNYRKDIYKEYKANRKKKDLPLEALEDTSDFLIHNWGAEVVHGIEADDAIGLAAAEDTIIITLDKDLDTIPGWHYNWNKDTIYFIEEEESFRNFCSQCLKGDSTDNIPGLYKITGNKFHRFMKDDLALLKDRHELWEYVKSKYKGHPMLHTIAQLVWIQRTNARTYEQYLFPGT